MSVKEKKIAIKIHRLKLAVIRLTDVDLLILHRIVQEEVNHRRLSEESRDNTILEKESQS